MAEYAGYVRDKDTGINWAEKMSGLGDKIEDAIGTRGRERQAFEDTRAENEEVINEYEAGSSQDFNNLIFNGANDAKELMYEWNKAASNGEMTQAEYKKRMNNSMSSWSQLSKTASTFDERNKEMLKRQMKNPETGLVDGSGYENYINMQAAMAADLAGSEVYFDPKTGKAFLTKVDKDGKIVSQTDVRQANNPGNMIDNRLNLGSAVKNGTKNWEDWTIATQGSLDKVTTETDQRLNLLNFTKSKNALINSILSNDRAIAGVLKDNTDDNYQFYITDEERDSNVEKQLETQRLDYNEAGVEFDEETIRAEIEARMIKTVKDATGVYQPELTEKQVQMAKDIVGTEIEMQTGHKETKTGGRAPIVRNKKDDGSGGNSGEGGGYYNYEAMINAFDRGDAGKMGSLNPNYDYSLDRKTWTWTISAPGKTVEGALIQGGEGKREEVYKPGRTVATVSKPSELANYIFKYGVKEGDDAASKYQRELEAYRKEFGTVSSEYAEKRKNPNWTKPKPKAYN